MFIFSLRLSDSFFYANLFPFSPSTTHVILHLSMGKEIVTPILTFTKGRSHIYIYSLYLIMSHSKFKFKIKF